MNVGSPSVATSPALCWQCGAEHVATQWATLQVVERVAPEEVKRLVLNWPADLAIEVRACRRCGAPIARKSAAPATSPVEGAAPGRIE